MNNTLKKNIGFSLLPIAFIFLFNPYLSVFDIPFDFVGYIIIYIAITNLADMNDFIFDAKALFRKAGFLSLIRVLSIGFLFGFLDELQRPVAILLVMFVLGIADILVLYPAYKNLFSGLTNLSYSHGGSYIISLQEKKTSKLLKFFNKTKTNRTPRTYEPTERIKAFTLFFIVFRTVMATLPEFTSLKDNHDYEFLGLLRIASFIIVGIVGIVWLTQMLKYFSNIRKDTIFINNLCTYYSENIQTKEHLFLCRKMFFGFSVLIVALIFNLDFYNNYINILPDFLFGIVLLVFCFVLKEYLSSAKLLSVFAVLSIITSAVAYTGSIIFFEEYSLGVIQKDYEAYLAYSGMVVFDLIKSIIFVIIMFIIAKQLLNIFIKHTLRDNNLESNIVYEENAKKSIIKDFGRKLLGIKICAGLVLLADLYYNLTNPLSISVRFFELSMIISIVVTLIFIAYSIRVILDLKEKIQMKYSN